MQNKRKNPHNLDEEMEVDPKSLIPIDIQTSNEQIEMEFVFLDPRPEQFHSVKSLLNSYLDGGSFQSVNLAELIVNQRTLGTMLSNEEPAENCQDIPVHAFVSIVNVGKNQNQKVIQEICQFILQKSKDFSNQQDHASLQNLFQNNLQQIGLLFNERIINLAPQVVPILHEQLIEDLKWIQQEHPEDHEAHFNIEYLLVITRVYRDIADKRKGTKEWQTYIYQKFEDFILLNKSELSFVFEAHSGKQSQAVTNSNKDYPDQVCYRVIYLVKKSVYLSSIADIKAQLQ